MRWEWGIALYAGYPSRSAWLKEISSKEHAQLVALSQVQPIGPGREDMGRAKCAIAIMRALGVKDDIDLNFLLPIEIPKKENTVEEVYRSLLSFSNVHNRKWQASQSEP